MIVFRPRKVEQILAAEEGLRQLVDAEASQAEIMRARAVLDAVRRSATADENYEADTEPWRRGRK